MVFGPRYVAYIPRFASRAAAVGIANLAFFCLDEAAMAACRALPGEDGSGRCIPGTPSILNKFTLPLVFAQLGQPPPHRLSIPQGQALGFCGDGQNGGDTRGAHSGHALVAP